MEVFLFGLENAKSSLAEIAVCFSLGSVHAHAPSKFAASLHFARRRDDDKPTTNLPVD